MGRLDEHLAVGVRDSQVTLDWQHIGPWRSLEEEELAGITDIDRGQWRDWTRDSFAHVANDGSTRAGLQEMTGRDLLLGNSFPFTVGDSAPPGGRWLGWKQPAPPPGRQKEGAEFCRPRHLIVWEEANGPAPEDHVVIRLDDDPTCDDIDNLMWIPRSALVRLNRISPLRLLPPDREHRRAVGPEAQIHQRSHDLGARFRRTQVPKVERHAEW